MRRVFISFVTLTAVSLGSLPAHAVEHEVYGALGFEGSTSPEFSGHGILLAHYRGKDVIGEADVDFIYNTDTLRLMLSDMCLSSVCFGAQIEGEALFAGLLSDYWQEGVKRSDRGFAAHWVGAGGFAKIGMGSTFLRYGAAVRHWFFSASDSNPPSFVLPAETTVFEQQLNFTYWGLESDPSLSQPHRWFPRIRGFALGIDAQVGLRRRARPWGAAEDPRNTPEPFSSYLRQWAWYGAQLHSRVRLQITEEAFFSRDLDDLNRRRLGGFNPYVAQLAGAPWAAFLSDRHLMVRASVHALIVGDVEAGLIVDAGIVQDVLRIGDRDNGGVFGLGAFVDAPLGPVYLHFAGGWSAPTAWQRDTPHTSVFVAVGSKLW